MRVNSLIFIIFSVLLTLCTCCDVNSPDFIVAPARPNQMALLAMVYNRFSPILELSAVLPFGGEPERFSINNAEVVFYEDGVPIDTFELLLSENDFLNDASGFYAGDTVELRDGSVYHIEANAEGYESVVTEPIVFRAYFDNDYTDFNVEIGPVINDEVEVITSLVFKLVDPPTDGFFLRKPSRLDEFVLSEIINSIGVRSILRSYLPNSAQIFFPTLLDDDLSYVEEINFFDVLNLNSNIAESSMHVTYISNQVEQELRPYSNMERELIGGAYSQPQPLISNVNNGYGYWVLADVVGGRYEP